MSHLRFKTRNLAKIYDIEKQQKLGHRSFREELARLLSSNRTRKSSSQNFIALQPCSLEIYAGESVALIGSNGSGKSTLLKILARVTHPSEGELEIWGRTSALLEVGTGFHPDLTGRENVYLSGAILGMHLQEIKKHFDEIVAFSEVESFIDTPVKKYSSGMFIRLAFSVMTHLNSDNLLLDEVIAVGDGSFQKKCQKKIKELTRQGKAIVIVSHDLHALEALCTRAIWLEKGRYKEDGLVSEIFSNYKAATLEPSPLS